MPPHSGRHARLLAAAAATLFTMSGLVTGDAAGLTTAASPPSASSPLCAAPRPGHRSCLGLAVKPSARTQPQRRPGVRPQTVEAPRGGYAPQDIQAAYGLTGTVPTNGAGQTVAVVDAYHDPNAAGDLATYRAYFGLPACSIGSGCVRTVDLSGGTVDPTGGWAKETSLDLDAVSAACPRCHILLVEALDNSDVSLIAAVQRATSLGASVLSLSFGGCESGGGSFDAALRQANVPITVASGDSGYFYSSQFCPAGTPEYPASSPYVTAVGGTTLNPSGNARGWSETVWSGTGSGCSGFEPKPAWQTDSGCNTRTVADVSADADPNTGVSVYDSFIGGNGWGEYGGTSLGAPLIAGMYALAGSPAAAIDGQIWYTTARVNDVTGGSNAPVASDCNPAYLCNAAVGYDAPTGAGAPNGPPIIDPTVTQLTTPWPSTVIPLSWSLPPNIQAVTYKVWEQDSTNGATQWVPCATTTGTSTSFYGFAGHTYGFAVQYFLAGGTSNGAPSQPATSTTIAANATSAVPFTSMYAVDGHGNLHPASSPQMAGVGWTWNIARGLVPSASAQGALVLDGWGGLHSLGDSGPAHATAYWPGWDIATGIATLPGRSSGYVLDGWGGLHPFSIGAAAMPAAATGNAVWPGWKITRGVAMFSNSSGGVVLDGWGGIHPFAVSPNARPATASTTAYWPGWDIARSVVLLPGSTATSYRGYVLDGWGGAHAFASVGTSLPATLSISGAYWPGWDIARSIVMVPGSTTAGYVVDGYGGFHPFGAAPTVVTPAYMSSPLVQGAGVG